MIDLISSLGAILLILLEVFGCLLLIFFSLLAIVFIIPLFLILIPVDFTEPTSSLRAKIKSYRSKLIDAVTVASVKSDAINQNEK